MRAQARVGFWPASASRKVAAKMIIGRRGMMCRAIADNMLKCILMAVLWMALPVYAADDLAAARELTVRQCSQCHTFDKGEKHGQGPNLFGLIGRPAAAAPGFNYSDGIKEALKGKVWDAALLDAWLTDTLAVAPKAQMIYWQDDPKVRATLILFFESQR
jgi:cytochrome c